MNDRSEAARRPQSAQEKSLLDSRNESKKSDRIPRPPQLPVKERESALPASHVLSLEVEVTQQFVGEAQGGYRTDLYYSGENSPLVIPPESPLPDSLRSLLEKACVLSGNDWVTVNSEAVLDFDSRITLALTPSNKLRCPIAGRLRGRAHLRDVLKRDGSPLFEARHSAAQVLDRWRMGFDDGSCLPLVLSASFDVPQRGFDDEQDGIYNELRGLASSLFIGCGAATFRQAPYGAVSAINLDLYKIEPVGSRTGY